jgi:hypothetical protein
MPWHRKLVSLGLLFLVPCSLVGQEPIGALLHGNGAIIVNGAQFKDSTALMPGDVVQTGATGLAYISSSGSNSTVESNSLIRIQTGGMALDLGGLSVGTSKGTSVFARDYKIAPANPQWTEFSVIRSGGSIQIMARKGDVTVSCGANTATVRESQQVSRNDAPDCGADPPQVAGGAPAAARGPILTSKTAEYAAFGVGVGLTIWVLLQSDNPASPAIP